MPSYGFIGPSSSQEGIAGDSERLLNLQAEKIGGTGASKGARYQYVHTPGLTASFSKPSTTVRAMWSGNNRLFVLGSTIVYEVFQDGTFAATAGGGVVGGAAGGTGQIVSNGTQLLVWNGDDGYDAFNTFLLDGASAPLGVISSQGITYMDGYFVALRPGIPTGHPFAGGAVPINTPNQTQFNYSDPLDGTSWPVLNYIIRSGAPDALQMIVGPGSFNGGPEELWLMGQKTMEVFYNSGELPPADPFTRVHGAFQNTGVWAKHSIVGFPHTIVFLSRDDRGGGSIKAMNGYTPVTISDAALENFIRQYSVGSDLSLSIAYGYHENDQDFYVLTFPNPGGQWVYSFSSQMWHQRATGTDIANLVNVPAQYHAYVFGKHLVGDPVTGNIYEASRSVYQNHGNNMVRMRITPHFNNEQRRTRFPMDQLDVGGPFSANRTYTREISVDGGQSYGTPQNTVVGPTGNSTKRVIWRRGGATRDRVLRITSQNNAAECWVDAYTRPKLTEGLP